MQYCRQVAVGWRMQVEWQPRIDLLWVKSAVSGLL